MSENPNQPKEYDAVLGGQNPPPINAAVLGGIQGVKKRLASSIAEERINALSDALKYGEKELDLVLQALQDESIEVQFTAYSLLKDRQEPRVKQQLDKILPFFEFEVVTVDASGQINSCRCHYAQYFTEDLGNGVGLEMVAIPGGTFLMGSPETEKDRDDTEIPQHQVTVKPFFMGKYPVTQKQWQAVAALPLIKTHLKPNPSSFKGENRPVEQISLYEAEEFCARLSKKTGKTYRLPSEAEWEYGCRAETTTPFHFGETITTNLVNYNWKDGKTTTPVGGFPPNAFGLYDMHGNIYEWCADSRNNNYNGAPNDGSIWTSGGYNDYRPQRGGSWRGNPWCCRSAFRGNSMTSAFNRSDVIGFRVVCSSAWTLYDKSIISENTNQPKEYGAVLGRQNPPPINVAILSGIEEVKKRLASSIVEVRINALSDGLKYGEKGLDLVLQALQDESIDVRFAAYSLLKDRQEPRVKQQLDNCVPLFEFEVVTVDGFGQIKSRRRHSARYFTEDLGNGVGLEMVAIPGETQIGSLLKDVHPEVYVPEVTIKPFFMSKYPITQEQWQAVMGDNPSHFKGAKRPVENVSLDGVGSFCGRLSKKTGKGYRLPSQLQWIYACHAGTTTPFYFGVTITPDLVNYNGNHQETTPVGSFPPNAFGLYDMHGNVREVSGDSWIFYHYSDTHYRIVCGGSWGDKAESCHSASADQIEEAYIYESGRYCGYGANNLGSGIGFRVVCSLATL